MGIRTNVAVLATIAAVAAAPTVPTAQAATSAGHRALLWDDARGDTAPVQAFVVESDGAAHSLGEAEAVGWTADGDEVVVLDEDAVRAVQPDAGTDRLLADVRGAVSPDASWVAYNLATGQGQDRRVRTYIKPAIDGEPVQVGAPVPGSGRVTEPQWDPESHRIAWIGDGPAVWVADTDGNAQRLTDADVNAFQLAWSPSGDRIAFVGAPAGSDPDAMAELYLVDADGGPLRRLSDLVAQGETALQHTPPAWHPDTTRIAVAIRPESGGVTVAIAGVRQGGTTPLSTHADAAVIDRFSWTPDGRQIAYAAGEQDSGCSCTLWNAWMVDLDGHARTRLDADGDDTFTSSERNVVYGPGVVRRLAGQTRIETAIDVSNSTFGASTVAVLARSDLYPDALSGAPLAHAQNAPLLLTPSDGLHPDVAEELTRLGVETVFLLGSEVALSSQVVEDLEAIGITDVRRRGGTDRFGTARLIARELGPTVHAYVVEGRDADPNRGWPDAVSVAPLAAYRGSPVLLVETESLPDETARALDELGIEQVTIVGGLPAVSEDVERAIAARDITVERLAGENRYETSLAVAEAALDAGMSAATTWLATGRNWPDALGAGPTVSTTSGILLLADGFGLDGSPSVRTWVHDQAVREVVLVGGPDVLAPRVAVELEGRLDD